MGIAGVFGLMAAVFALVAGLLVGQAAYRAYRRRKNAAAMLSGDRAGKLSVILGRGFTPLLWISKRLLRVHGIDEVAKLAVRALELKGVAVSPASLLSWFAFALVAIGVGVGVAFQSAVGALAVTCVVALGVAGSLRAWGERQFEEMRDEIPEAIRAMSVCFRSGLSLPQMLDQVSREIKGPLGGRFAAAARRLEMGSPPAEALAVLRDGGRIPEMAFVAVALDVQHQSGGSIASVLESARDSVEGELELLRSLKVQTAQARLSARIVTVMPFILVALFSLVSSDFMVPFFSSFAGMCLLALALVMQLAGVLVVRRMLKIEAG